MNAVADLQRLVLQKCQKCFRALRVFVNPAKAVLQPCQYSLQYTCGHSRILKIALANLGFYVACKDYS